MRSLPLRAKTFLVTIYLLGLTAVSAAIWRPLPHASAPLWEVLVFVVLAGFAGSKKIALLPNLPSKDAGSMSLGFISTFAAMLRFGPAIGMLIGAVSTFCACIYPKRQAIHQITFNVALGVLGASLGGLTFLAINGWTMTLRPLETFLAVVGATMTFFLVNTGSVAAIIGLCTGERPFRLWRQTFLWTAPSYFAGACFSTLAMVLFGRHLSATLLFAAPVVYFSYQSYSSHMARIDENRRHLEEMQRSQAHLADLYLATIKSLALAIDAKDQYTHQHILRVQRYSVAVAKQMGLTGSDLEGVNTGALLHDIGKLGVPEYVLLKPGRLTDEEFEKIKKHPEIGAAILDPVEFPWPVLPAVKYHHEKWDGTGYPEGLKGEDIPLTARILAVADVYDALTSSRSYRTAWSHEKAVSVIKKDAGSHFDPVVVEAFLQVIDGVVQEMAAEGDGPLIVNSGEKIGNTKTDQAASAIQRASSELWALYEVAHTLSSSLGLQETIDILARKLEVIFPGTACLFLLKEAEQERLRAHCAIGLNTHYFTNCHTINDHSRSWQVAAMRASYLGEFDQDDLMLAHSQSMPWIGLKSALIVPIVHQGETLGTINLYHTETDAFNKHDLQLLETIAERAAMAIYNGLLHDRARGQEFTDTLTGIYNIRYITQYLEERCRPFEGRTTEAPSAESDAKSAEVATDAESVEVATDATPTLRIRAQDRFCLLCLDLDSFRAINANFGHQKGDAVLRALVNIFQETVRTRDVVARYSGDKFLIVLDGAEQADAENVTERLLAAIEAYDAGLMHPKLGQLSLGVSIGHACFPIDGLDCPTLLSAADACMHRRKIERKLGNLVSRDKSEVGAAEPAPDPDYFPFPKAA
jgi:diguanylate cyclase (GGDEF)-like protein/putative nucleotidyltransferase with HDIG domain